MKYRVMNKTGDKLSVLGYGAMRFPQKNGKIDVARTERQIIQAIESGINYFDTAYFYQGGKSEGILGDVLAKGYRDKVKLATKLPLFLVHKTKDISNLFETQLKRLKTDHIDYYLMHGLSDMKGWIRLKDLGILEFIEEERKRGRIINIGFSFHGDKEEFKAIVDDYDWDFCQIQYNYLDENFQAGKEGLEYAAAKGLGIIIMEPLRGGSLVGRIPKEVQAIWDSARVKRSPAEWGLRWIWNHPQVNVVLSGMSRESDIEENARVADEAEPNSLTDEEMEIIERVKETYNSLMRVGCTECRYCMPCPFGVDIPMAFKYYNNKHMFNLKHANYQYLAFAGGSTGGKVSYAWLCKDCGKCESKCPQNIAIRERLKEVSKDMDNKFIRAGLWALRKVLKKKKENK